jgi:hypothetical protein
VPCSTEPLAPCSVFRLVLAEPVGLRSSQDNPGGKVLADIATKGQQQKVLDRVVIRFAGDSGDGMQLAGDRLTTR